MERLVDLFQCGGNQETDVTVVVGRAALVLDYPYDWLYWIHRLVRCYYSLTEARLRCNLPLMIGWHNVEVHSVLQVDRHALYVPVPAW